MNYNITSSAMLSVKRSNMAFKPGLENEKKIQSVHSEQNRYFNVSVPAFLMYYYLSETG